MTDHLDQYRWKAFDHIQRANRRAMLLKLAFGLSLGLNFGFAVWLLFR